MDSGMNERISPLRGNLSHNDIVNQTKVVQNGLSALREDHYNILNKIREEFENDQNANNVKKKKKPDGSARSENASLLEDRIMNVTHSLEQLEMGIEESTALLALSDHFHRLEAERSTLRLEIGRVQDENDWLRDELSDTQKQLQEALLELTDLREEKKKWEFEEELKNVGSDSPNVRPITPSKIPVGAWRVEEEKDINRALSGGSSTRSSSPAPSRIPVGGWRSKLTVYKSVMEKEEKKVIENRQRKSVGKKQYFNLNAPNRASKIPSR